MLTGVTAATMSMAVPVFADKKKCEDNDNNNCNDTHKTQKIEEKNKCKIENENEDHSKNNENLNELACVNLSANAKDVLVFLQNGQDLMTTLLPKP
jgi:hypothetical protein